MEIDPFDERELYGRQQQQSRNETVSTTISTIVVQGGPLQLVIALLRVREIVRHLWELSKYRISPAKNTNRCHLIYGEDNCLFANTTTV